MYTSEMIDRELANEANRILARGIVDTADEAITLAERELVLAHRMRIQGQRDLLADAAKFLGVEADQVPLDFLCRLDEVLQGRIDHLAMGRDEDGELLSHEVWEEAKYRANLDG